MGRFSRFTQISVSSLSLRGSKLIIVFLLSEVPSGKSGTLRHSRLLLVKTSDSPFT